MYSHLLKVDKTYIVKPMLRNNIGKVGVNIFVSSNIHLLIGS